jgi:hypothetical protein
MNTDELLSKRLTMLIISKRNNRLKSVWMEWRKEVYLKMGCFKFKHSIIHILAYAYWF